MLTSPGPDANRGDHPQTGLVVRLSVPGVQAEGPRPQQPGPDLRGIARAVEDLVHAVAPDVLTSVEIELREPARPAEAPAKVGQRRWNTEDSGRPTALAPVPAAQTPDEPSAGEPFDVDTTRRTLELDGEPVELTRREFDLLAFLERHRGQALGRDELMRAVWHTGYISGDRTIDVHVRRLRVKLGSHADRLVTLRGYGYRLD